MCGIIGFVSNVNDFNPGLFAKANNLVRYRGPDSFGYITFNARGDVKEWHDENLGDYQYENTKGAFGFRRLAIIDLTPAGHQPMSDRDGKIWIIFNGEIYNYIEIKTRLIKIGYSFKSSSDTEVIIYSYLEWGVDCLQHFNGMFSFSIYDIIKKTIFCVRDRMGIKPFYYYFDSYHFGFSSEIKQLLGLFGDQKMNNLMVTDFIVRGSYGNYNEDSYYTNIKILEPGHYLFVDLKNEKIEITKKCWWKLSDTKSLAVNNDKEVFEKTLDLLTESTKIRLRSDVALGTALSGGLDSSGIVGVLHKLLAIDRKSNKTFTVISDDNTIEDPYYANLLLNEIPAEAHKLNFNDVANLETLKELLWHQEEPIQNTTILGSWYLYQFIKENNVTVVLDGQGADELLGGYETHPFILSHLDQLRNGQYGTLISSIVKSSKYNNKSAFLTVGQLIKGIFFNQAKNYPRVSNYFRFSELSNYLTRDFRHSVSDNLFTIDSKSKSIIVPDSLMKRKSLQLTTQTNLPGILRQVDRNSMAFSVEARLPFLDFNLVEYLYSLPESFMVRNGITKYAYRESLKGIIPEKVRLRKSKEGFKMPEYEFIRKNQDTIIGIFEENRINNFFNVDTIIKGMKLSLLDKKKYNNIYFRALIYFLWKERFNT